MNDLNNQPTPAETVPPEQTHLTWRNMIPEDLEAILALSRAGLMVDGGLPFLFEADIIQSRYFPEGPGAGIVGFAPEGHLAACAAAHRIDPQKVLIVGLVHPQHRQNGIGKYLIDWSQAEGIRLFNEPATRNSGAAAGGRRVMQIATESLTEPAHQLYLAHGFTNVFEEVVMRYDLSRPVSEHPLPPDTTFTSWRSELAAEFYQAYQEAFRERPGFPGWSAAEWIGT